MISSDGLNAPAIDTFSHEFECASAVQERECICLGSIGLGLEGWSLIPVSQWEHAVKSLRRQQS